VKTDPWKLRGGPNGGTILVALGGILFSLATGVVFSIILRFLPAALYDNVFAARIPQLVLVFAVTNFALAIFNILPLYPLDGYQIVYALLPSRQAIGFARSAPYGQFIILLVIFFLPFIGQISGAGSFFLFHLTFYILQGATQLVSSVSGISTITSSLPTINQFSLLDFYVGF
jgi:Zn-dependent protease